MEDNEFVKKILPEDEYPHSPSVLDREEYDGGFSKGWQFHCVPMEKYWLDAHTHIMYTDPDRAILALKAFRDLVNLFNVKRIVAFTPIVVTEQEQQSETYTSRIWLEQNFSNNEAVCSFLARLREVDRIYPFLFLNYSRPDPALIEKSVSLGIRGIKFHNATLICEAGDPEVWLSKAWSEAFEVIGKHRQPVIWHVAQRMNKELHEGGGKKANYWEDGWKKGVTYTNEDLLQVFLRVVQRFPNINFVGAHMMHMGWERLSELFDQNPNLYVDTSIGGMVRQDYEVYEHDRAYLRHIFKKYGNRILFGTDSMIYDNWREGIEKFYVLERAYKDHMRYFRNLRLSYDVLQQMSHGNMERLMGINDFYKDR